MFRCLLLVPTVTCRARTSHVTCHLLCHTRPPAMTSTPEGTYQFLSSSCSKTWWILHSFAVNKVVAIIKVQRPLAEFRHLDTTARGLQSLLYTQERRPMYGSEVLKLSSYC